MYSISFQYLTHYHFVIYLGMKWLLVTFFSLLTYGISGNTNGKQLANKKTDHPDLFSYETTHYCLLYILLLLLFFCPKL